MLSTWRIPVAALILIAGATPEVGAQVRSDSSGVGSAAWHPYLLGTQINVIGQDLRPFPSPYEGANSLRSRGDSKISDAYGAYGGIDAGHGVQAYLDVEMIRGGGIGRVVGLAGPTNGDVLRQGTADLGSGPYVARAFVRYVVSFSSRERDTLPPVPDQIPSIVSARRLEVVAGKLANSDLFDVNRYANSTRLQFMNWSLFQNTAWDFAADTRGYSNGVAVALIQPAWTLRAGSFQMSREANGNVFDSDLRRARGDQIELTLTAPRTQTIARILGYLNHARMGSYAEALALGRAQGRPPDVAADDRPGRTKYGFGLNLEQPLSDDGETGLFARLGWSDGRNESFAFTEVDRHLSFGAQFAGGHWGRANDRIGLGAVREGIVALHQDYLSAGGLGFLLGDGRLNYGSEQIVEGYYRLQAGPYLQLSPDLQHIRNPGYNRDRGPATVFSLRMNLRY
jgi:high affinity Mn2+ porin